MARLQRKKATSVKKKKKIEDEHVDAGSPAAAAKPALVNMPAKDSRKKAAPVKKAEAVKASQGKIGGAISKSVQFLREVRVELKKVAWPTRKQTMGSTLVVLVLVLIISLFLGVVDLALQNLIRFVL